MDIITNSTNSTSSTSKHKLAATKTSKHKLAATKTLKIAKSQNADANKNKVASAVLNLGMKSQHFASLLANVTSSTVSATTAMLEQSQLVLEVSTDYRTGLYRDAVKQFRENTNLTSASKWSQFKRIGKVANQLLAVAGRLPSGWSSLYSIASAMTNKTPLVLDTLLNASVTTKKGVVTLNTYSTQSEVRALVANAGGRVPTQRVRGTQGVPSYVPVFHIALDGIDAETIDADIVRLTRAITDAVKQFPWVTLGDATLNALAKEQIAVRKKLAKVA